METNHSKESIKELIDKNISPELAEKLKEAKTDVEVCKLLADNGVDVEKLQKQIPDEALDQIGGGYTDMFGDVIDCPCCGNKEKDEISYQFFASLYYMEAVYRCRKCGCLFGIDINNITRVIDE